MNLTQEQIKEIRIKAQRELAKRNFKDYLVYVNKGNYKHFKHTEIICNAIEPIANGIQKKIIIEMPPRHGKQISDNTPILTTKGWKKHGDLTTGDYVFHPSGLPVKVIGISDKTPSDYVVTFTNGEQIRCHENHEWTIYNRNKRRYETLETKSMIKDVWNGRAKYQLPYSKAVRFETKKLALDPYVLGVWLGDGTSSKPAITYDKKDVEMINEIVRRGYEISVTHVHKITGVPTTNFAGTRHNPGKMTKELKEINVMNNKHIPEKYLRSSSKQRLELLAGLIDSDGHVDVNGRVRISTTRKLLSENIYDLCAGLGLRPYIETKKPFTTTSNITGKQMVYVIGFMPTMDIPCVLERKKTNRLIKQNRIGIKSIEYKPNGEKGHCIQVESKDGLYLVGKTLLPTHNSMTVTESFPSFYIGRNPNKRVISTAYSDGLANKFGRLNRAKLFEYGAELFDITISAEKSASKDWGITEKNGGMISTGIGGSITGQGADLLIIDDPIKNRKEAESKTMRDMVWDEWQSTLLTRLHDGGSVIVIMTRWHEDDFVGRLLEQEPTGWERIRLPAIAEDEDDLAGRQEGEALCPELGYDENWAIEKKMQVGSKTWASLYQQRPSPASGGIFKRKWFKYYTQLPKIDEYVTSWDLTFKDADSSDYVVGQVWGRSGVDKYLIDEVRDRMDFPQTLQAIKTLSKKYPKCRTILIEDKANGPAVISTLKRQIVGIIPVNPDGGKVVRANAVSPEFEAGNIYIPENASFTSDYVEEMITFPNGKNDDRVDATTQAINRFAEKRKAMVSNINAW